MAVKTEMVTDAGKFRYLLSMASEQPSKGIDCEANVKVFKKSNGKSAIDPRTFKVVGGSLYFPAATSALYFPFLHTSGGNLPRTCLDEWLQWMAMELLDGDARVSRSWVHNGNAELQMLANHGLMTQLDNAPGLCDSMVTAWLLGYGGDRDDGAKFEALGLKDLRTRVLHLGARAEFEDIAKGRQACDIPSTDMTQYAALDAYDAWAIGESLWPRLERAGLVDHLLDVDQPMSNICRLMEEEGWDIDVPAVQRLQKTLGEEAAAIAARFREKTTALVVDVEDLPTQVGVFKNGKPKFLKLPTDVVKVRGGDVGNDRDCARFIFDELRALPRSVTKINKDGTPSLRKDVVEGALATHAGTLGAELLDMRFEFKKRNTLVTNFCVPFVHLTKCYADERLHSRFEVTGTGTQRLASSNPNTQNCPARSDEGKAIRAAMVAMDGWEIGVWDLSQAELRVAAHFSRDPELMRCYTPGTEEDIHAGTLARLHELGWTKAKRVDAKTSNFSVIYNITAPALAVKMKCSVEQARWAIEAFHKRFVFYNDFVEWCYEFVREHGYMKTLDGFKRPLSNELHYDKFLRRKDLHWSVRNQCANTAIQGSVAGWAKIAMIRIREECIREKLWQTHVRFKAQEHDSVVAMARAEVKDQVDEIVTRHMSTALPLRVPMKVEGGWGKSWGEAKG